MEGLEALVNLEKLWICEVGSQREEICHTSPTGLADVAFQAHIHCYSSSFELWGRARAREVVCLSSVVYGRQPPLSMLHVFLSLFADGSTPQMGIKFFQAYRAVTNILRLILGVSPRRPTSRGSRGSRTLRSLRSFTSTRTVSR
jgi:hypothetical protein